MATSAFRRFYCPHFAFDSPQALFFSKAERIGIAIKFRQVFQSAKHRTWRYFLIGDESWFYCKIYHDPMWVPDREEVPTRLRRTITSSRQMLTVFWSLLGVFLVETLPKGIHFDSQYFCSNILSAIVRNRLSESPGDQRRRMVVHFDNPTPHTPSARLII
jgi:hypothetical protein